MLDCLMVGAGPALHAEALKTGQIRYYPVCDGYEVTDKRVAVIRNDPAERTEIVRAPR